MRRGFGIGRLLVVGIGLLVCLSLVGWFATPASAAAAKDEIVFLNAGQLSGPYAETGRDQSRGVKLAIDEFGGKLLGKKFRLIERDVPNPSEE